MAGRRKRSESDAPALDLTQLDVQDAEPGSVTWRESTREPSPLQGVFDASAEALSNGASEGTTKQVYVGNEDATKQVVAAVRRAATFRNLGAKVKTEQLDADTFRVSFAAKPRKAPRKYTMTEVRQWATEQGHQLPEQGRIPGDVTKAYREAHGL